MARNRVERQHNLGNHAERVSRTLFDDEHADAMVQETDIRILQISLRQE